MSKKPTISIDFFGTLDTDSEFWLEMLEYLKIEGYVIYVIGGGWRRLLLEQLSYNGYNSETHFNNVYSIFSELEDNDEKVWYDELLDCWKTDIAAYWASKAQICQNLGCHIHFDNDVRFKSSFSLIPTRFVYLRDDAAMSHLLSLHKELKLSNSYDEWEDQYMFMSGIYPG